MASVVAPVVPSVKHIPPITGLELGRGGLASMSGHGLAPSSANIIFVISRNGHWSEDDDWYTDTLCKNNERYGLARDL